MSSSAALVMTVPGGKPASCQESEAGGHHAQDYQGGPGEYGDVAPADREERPDQSAESERRDGNQNAPGGGLDEGGLNGGIDKGRLGISGTALFKRQRPTNASANTGAGTRASPAGSGPA